MKKIFIILALILTSALLFGCSNKQINEQKNKNITINYFKLFENEENLEPIFKEFEKQNPNIKINYKKFTDPENYLNEITSDIKNKRGPDIFSVPNSWINANSDKIYPAPKNIFNAKTFKKTFVDIASKDNLIESDNQIQVFGIPLSVDNLALYYNKDHFKNEFNETTVPSTNFEELIKQAQKLTKKQNNLIIRSGISIGRGDNILRSADILLAIFLQKNIKFYNEDHTKIILSNNNETIYVIESLSYFANPKNPNQLWNEKIASFTNSEQEIESFITGKTSMIFGFSNLYKDIQELTIVKKRLGINTINPESIAIAEMPQVNSNKKTLAKYFTETVNINSEYPNESWKLLKFISEKENLQKYYKTDFKPSSRKDLLNEQLKLATYKPFLNQIQYSDSIPFFNQYDSEKLLKKLYKIYSNKQEISENLNAIEIEFSNQLKSYSPK